MQDSLPDDDSTTLLPRLHMVHTSQMITAVVFTVEFFLTETTGHLIYTLTLSSVTPKTRPVVVNDATFGAHKLKRCM